MALFNNLIEVVLFLVWTALIWGDWYSPTLSIYSDFGLFKKWHRRTRRLFWLPPLYVVPTLIVILYVFIEISICAYYRSSFTEDEPNWVVTALTFLFLFNLIFLKHWISTFMNGGRTLFSLVFIL
jgi:hypothetical protein